MCCVPHKEEGQGTPARMLVVPEEHFSCVTLNTHAWRGLLTREEGPAPYQLLAEVGNPQGVIPEAPWRRPTIHLQPPSAWKSHRGGQEHEFCSMLQHHR